MKTATVKAPSVISVDDGPDPEPGPGEILVQMQACGICGSDLEKVFGEYGSPSMRLGHEPAGTVVGAGPGVTEFREGDRVFTHHHVPCYSCHLCRHGSETMCPRYYETNLQPCGLSERYVVPKWNVAHGGVLKLSDSTTFEEAAMVEPLACCVRAWGRCGAREGGTVAIFGAGPTGMMHVLLAQARRFSKVFCLDVNDFRLDFARRFGVTGAMNAADADRFGRVSDATGGLGVDLAVVATSSLRALDDAIGMVRKGGSVMMFGVPSKGATINLDMNRVYSKEVTIRTSYAASDADTGEALGLIESGRIGVKRLITHRYPIPEAQRAFEHARVGGDAMKIVITGQPGET